MFPQFESFLILSVSYCKTYTFLSRLFLDFLLQQNELVKTFDFMLPFRADTLDFDSHLTLSDFCIFLSSFVGSVFVFPQTRALL